MVAQTNIAQSSSLVTSVWFQWGSSGGLVNGHHVLQHQWEGGSVMFRGQNHQSCSAKSGSLKLWNMWTFWLATFFPGTEKITSNRLILHDNAPSRAARKSSASLAADLPWPQTHWEPLEDPLTERHRGRRQFTSRQKLCEDVCRMFRRPKTPEFSGTVKLLPNKASPVQM